MSGLYDPTLAAIHADGYATTYAAGFDWLADRIARGPAPARLFDIGCGDGTWLAHARAAGIPGAGCDLSPAFVDMARARGLDVTQARAATAPVPPGTTAITALGEVLSYIDPETGTDSLAAALAIAARCLPPGGCLIADLIGPDTPARTGTTTGTDWRMTSTTTIHDDTLTRRMEITTGRDHSVTEHRQTLTAPDHALALARAAGLTATTAGHYGPCPLLPGRYMIEARRP